METGCYAKVGGGAALPQSLLPEIVWRHPGFGFDFPLTVAQSAGILAQAGAT
jgi:hypothetical protein